MNTVKRRDRPHEYTAVFCTVIKDWQGKEQRWVQLERNGKRCNAVKLEDLE